LGDGSNLSKVLTNVNVLSTGFNAPNIDCIVMLRPTMSAGLYIQQVGRGFRTAPGKDHFIVLDFAGNVKRHDPLDDPAIAKPKRDGGQRAKECQTCGTLNAMSAKTCSWCGEDFPLAVTRSFGLREPTHFSHGEDGALFASDQKPFGSVNVTDWSFCRHLQ
jgi:superfamily II DNA or RNA helicase